jgi:hypothetical protein
MPVLSRQCWLGMPVLSRHSVLVRHASFEQTVSVDQACQRWADIQCWSGMPVLSRQCFRDKSGLQYVDFQLTSFVANHLNKL